MNLAMSGRVLRLKQLATRVLELLYDDDGPKRLAPVALFLLILSPVLALSALTYKRTDRHLTAFALSQRQSLAHVAAVTVKERFGRLVDIAESLASRVRFRKLVAEGEWADAIEILASVPKDFPFVERLFLADLAGTLWADTPALPDIRGKNFSDRDWYRGVSRNRGPYVSEVYRRAARPQYNVFAVATPVKDGSGAPVAILVLQVKLDFLLQWINATNSKTPGWIVLVDQRGTIAAHPRLSPQGELIDYRASVPVQKLLTGESGVGVFVSPMTNGEQVVAFEPVSEYGWGVLVEQPYGEAFPARDKALNSLIIAYAVIGLFTCVLAYLILHFMAEQKRVQNEIRKLNGQLTQKSAETEAANKELEAFSYSVSHDLRAPLRAIDGFSRILLDEHAASLSKEGQRLLKVARENAVNMGQLIDELLTFSRLSRQPLGKTRVETAELARQVFQDLRAQENGRQIEVSLAELPPCQGDPRLLRQVFVNLVANAFKYTRKRPVARIEVGFEKKEGEIVYFIKDNGVGFDMRYADKLFRVFQRLHRAEDYEGTGVGLAIVQRVIQRHGGRVWAEADVDRGATFYFTVGGKHGCS
ncbi:MAG TPA: cache domain-containing protein [Candidatus Eisenbacteria bacterium]|nr:cache domain-containing protein [Candidatus Eisenbacteria bacterium]